MDMLKTPQSNRKIRAKKVLVVLTDSLLKQVDRQARKVKLNRSEFVRIVLSNHFLQLSVDESLAQENSRTRK